ncbi:MAG TPA: hypothetical protein PKK59_06680 [Anaerolineaceae bacterium]|nr:hypothetical protein [Anaerolineaceae bacterium]
MPKQEKITRVNARIVDTAMAVAGSSSRVNSAINTAAAQEGGIGGVHNCVNLQAGDITHKHAPFSHSSLPGEFLKVDAI